MSDIIGRIEGFFSRAGAEVRTGTATEVFGAIGIAGILEIISVIISIIEIKAVNNIEVKALSFYIKYNKIVL